MLKVEIEEEEELVEGSRGVGIYRGKCERCEGRAVRWHTAHVRWVS